MVRYKFSKRSGFYRGLSEPFGHWIIITLYFDDLSESEEEQVLANYTVNDGNDIALNKFVFPEAFSPIIVFTEPLTK